VHRASGRNAGKDEVDSTEDKVDSTADAQVETLQCAEEAILRLGVE
jgi:hypothetical protein